MTNVVVCREIVVGRPIEVVRAQFSDMKHHEANAVHSTLNVSNVRPQADGGCLFTGRRRVLGTLQQDEIQVTRQPDGSLTLRSIAGSNEGVLITQRFEAQGPDRTRVEVTVDLPVRGVMRWLRPLVRQGVAHDVAAALQEDRADLEQGAYARRPAA